MMTTLIRTASLAVTLLVCVQGLPALAASGDETLLFGAPLAEGRLAATCFQRRYDDAHMAAHPEQNVTAMTILAYRAAWVDAPVILDLALTFRNADAPVKLSGGCSASADPVDRLACGIECDGGSFTLTRDGKGRLLVGLDGDLNLCGGEDEAMPGAELGADDRRFRLESVPASACGAIASDDDVRLKLTLTSPAP